MIYWYLDNMKHRMIFKTIHQTRFYRWFWCVIALYIFIAPVIILEYKEDLMGLTHYNMVEYASIALLIDPLLVLVFMGTNKFKRSFFMIAEIFTSVALISLSTAADFLIPNPPKNFEESNYFYFLIYSAFCFSKALRLFDSVLREMAQIKAVLAVFTSLRPFLDEIFGTAISLFLVFGQVSILLGFVSNLIFRWE